MILSTLDTTNYGIRKNSIIAAVCLIFACVYEYFSHQVYSVFMLGAFLIPLVLGVIPGILRKYLWKKRTAGWGLLLQQCGIYTLIFGSIFRGILDIYGTTNQSGVIYWYVGAAEFALGVVVEIALGCRQRW